MSTTQPSPLAELKSRLLEILQLKQLPRSGWLRIGVRSPESVAAHCWGVAWLVLALCPPEIDRGRALAMAVLHDLAEVRTGDLTPHDRIAQERKRHNESRALERLLMPLAKAKQLHELWQDYENGASAEGLFVKACDKLDMALQAEFYRQQQQVPTDEFVDSALAQLDRSELTAIILATTNGVKE